MLWCYGWRDEFHNKRDCSVVEEPIHRSSPTLSAAEAWSQWHSGLFRLEATLAAMDDRDFSSCCQHSTAPADNAVMNPPLVSFICPVHWSQSSYAWIDDFLYHQGFEVCRLPSPVLAWQSDAVSGLWMLLQANSYWELQVRAERQVRSEGRSSTPERTTT